MREKKEQATTIHPCSVSHFRFVGSARAGREMMKVAKTSSALTRPAVALLAYEVGLDRTWHTGQGTLVQQQGEGNIGGRQGRLQLLLAKEEKATSRPPQARKRKLTTR